MIKSSSSTKILYLVKKSLTKLLSKVKTASTRINSQPLRIASIFVLRPITIPKAPNKIDLPAPVSPVSILRPLSKSICTCSIKAKFQIDSVFNMNIPQIN